MRKNVRKKSAVRGKNMKKSRAVPIVQMCESAGMSLPSKKMNLWISAYFHPEDTIGKERKSANFGNVVTNLIFAGIIVWMVMTLAICVASVFEPRFAPNIIPEAMIGLIMYPFGALIFGIIGSGIWFVIAKILGGKGSYLEQSTGIAYVYGGSILVSSLFSILSGIPYIGIAAGVAGILIGIYTIYNYYRVIKCVHGFSGIKAAAVILITIAIIIGAFAALAGMIVTNPGI